MHIIYNSYSSLATYKCDNDRFSFNVYALFVYENWSLPACFFYFYFIFCYTTQYSTYYTVNLLHGFGFWWWGAVELYKLGWKQWPSPTCLGLGDSVISPNGVGFFFYPSLFSYIIFRSGFSFILFLFYFYSNSLQIFLGFCGKKNIENYICMYFLFIIGEGDRFSCRVENLYTLFGYYVAVFLRLILTRNVYYDQFFK